MPPHLKVHEVKVSQTGASPFISNIHGPHFSNSDVSKHFIPPKFIRKTIKAHSQQEIKTSPVGSPPVSKTEDEILDTESAYFDLPDDLLSQFNYLAKEWDSVAKIQPFLKDATFTLGLDKPSIAIDLDETLIHTTHARFKPQYAGYLECIEMELNSASLLLIKRPFLDMFLSVLSQNYNLVIFTSSARKYAQSVVQAIDPTNKYNMRLLCRENCLWVSDKILLKNLYTVSKDISNVLILDNSIISFAAQMQNGIYVKPFIGQVKDTELLNIVNLLAPFSKLKSFKSFESPLPKMFDYHINTYK